MIEFTNRTPTIAQVYQYTYSNPKTRSRFENEERDILKSKVKIQKRTVYKRNKENKQMTAEERLYIYTESTPQYYPYSKVKSKGAIKQRKIHHQYDTILLIQKDSNGEYNFWNSKIVWRVGSFKKYPKVIPQSKVKQIHHETRERLEKKYSKLPMKEKRIAINKELDKIRKRAKYLSDGDYVAQEYGIMLDVYFRDHFIQKQFDCLYGRCWHNEETQGIDLPFADKHLLAILHFCMKKGIIKSK